MRYGQSNSIGALITIVIGVCAFAGWLYVCYPETADALAYESRQSWSFLVLIGFVVVAIIGVSIAGSLLVGLMHLLKSLVQLGLIVAVIVGGVMLWRREPITTSLDTQLPHQSTTYEIPQPRYRETVIHQPKPPAKGKWWEQSQSE